MQIQLQSSSLIPAILLGSALAACSGGSGSSSGPGGGQGNSSGSGGSGNGQGSGGDGGGGASSCNALPNVASLAIKSVNDLLLPKIATPRFVCLSAIAHHDQNLAPPAEAPGEWFELTTTVPSQTSTQAYQLYASLSLRPTDPDKEYLAAGKWNWILNGTQGSCTEPAQGQEVNPACFEYDGFYEFARGSFEVDCGGGLPVPHADISFVPPPYGNCGAY